MTELEQLAQAIRNLQPDNGLWSKESVARYLDVKPRTVTDKYMSCPGFPSPIRLPSEKGRGVLRWRSAEVIDWANKDL